jgi:hypothetical protein
MRLLGQYACDVIQRANLLNCWASDKYLAGDDLVKPFSRLDEDKARLEKLMHDVVFDKSLHSEIEKLDKKIVSNEAVLKKLEKECAAQGMTDRFCLQALKERTRFISEKIENESTRYSDATLGYRDAARKLGDMSLADRNPTVIRLKQEHDAKVSDLRKEFSKISDNIAALEGILRSFQW